MKLAFFRDKCQGREAQKGKGGATHLSHVLRHLEEKAKNRFWEAPIELPGLLRLPDPFFAFWILHFGCRIDNSN